jgi:DNA-binding NarL/FixJ family response regulator
MKIKIFLADDQYLMLESIKAILKHEPEIDIVGTAQDGHSTISQVIKLQPDLVLIDIEMPKINGIVATKYICKHMPDTRVIVLTSHKKQTYITQALKAGASGYLLKDSLIEDLKQAIHSLGGGYACVETQLLTKTINRRKKLNLVRHKKKRVYLPKYHKSIYQPAFRGQQLKIKQNYYNILVRNSVHSGVNKANLTPIFDLPSTSDILRLYQTKSQNNRLYIQPKFNRQSYLKRIIWMLIAIASFVLSVILF